MDVVLVPRPGGVEVIRKVRGLQAEGAGERRLVANEDRAGVDRRIEPLVGIDRDGIGEIESVEEVGLPA